MRARLSARLAAAAAAAPLAHESRAALLHRQPTPHSIASALVSLGVISKEKAKTVEDDLTRARQADQAGDTAACEQALQDIDRMIGP
jgi:polyhydroxyalkanoate synthesis regulator phasin